ncbi:MAG: hypothetical protein O2779_04155 [Nanoarchaeota archaeon]|nr:hypothetical protein [Nanoarchaeota archaeon]
MDSLAKCIYDGEKLIQESYIEYTREPPSRDGCWYVHNGNNQGNNQSIIHHFNIYSEESIQEFRNQKLDDSDLQSTVSLLYTYSDGCIKNKKAKLTLEQVLLLFPEYKEILGIK